ncbi:MAG TPA: hypothetical protein VLC95_10600 [Anaerolineae bacterium]|nr:hypothetical protein [Anaerolineae bacterium]
MSTFNPYLLMSLFYFSLAVVATAGSALVSADLLATAGSLRWLRVHFITLGMLTQAAMGVLPGLVADRAGQPRPRTRWDVWLLLNAGLLALLVGIPLVDAPMMIAGGTLVMVALALLAWQLRGLRAPASTSTSRPARSSGGSWFYRAALAYLLLGAFIGTGLWLGWSTWLHLPAPKEVHVHSNLWGFGSLLLAGLLLELVPADVLEQPGWRRSVRAIFWLMVVGALGLTVGPWVESRVLQSVGLVAHTAGTLWLIIRWARVMHARACSLPGALHAASAYVWQMVTVAMAPLVVFMPDGVIGRQVAEQGGPILIYGWLLQFSYGLLPYLFRRFLLPHQPARLGGSWLSLVAGHAGTLLYMGGLVVAALRPGLHAAGYALWAISAVPIVIDLWRVLQAALEGRPEAVPEPDSAGAPRLEGVPGHAAKSTPGS